MDNCPVADLRQTMRQRIKDRQRTIFIASIIVWAGIVSWIVATGFSMRLIA